MCLCLQGRGTGLLRSQLCQPGTLFHAAFQAERRQGRGAGRGMPGQARSWKLAGCRGTGRAAVWGKPGKRMDGNVELGFNGVLCWYKSLH